MSCHNAYPSVGQTINTSDENIFGETWSLTTSGASFGRTRTVGGSLLARSALLATNWAFTARRAALAGR